MGVGVGKVHRSLTFCQNFMTNGQLEAELLLHKGQCVYSIGRKMNFGQRANIKFCLKLGKTFTERFQLMKQVYGDNSLFRARVQEWLKRFKEGREDIKIFFATHGNGIKHVKRFNSSHFDRKFAV